MSAVRNCACLIALTLVWVATWSPSAHGQDREQRELEQVRQRIEALQQRLAREQRDRDAGTQALREVELAIAAGERELSRLRAARETQLERQRALNAETEIERQRLSSERRALAQLVRSSYMSGSEEVFKLLLSQESPALLGRMLVYYEHFSRARSERIARVRSELERLADLKTESERVAQALAELERAQTVQLEALSKSREERQEVLARLDESISAAGGEIERLQAEEQRLTELVMELRAALSEFPVDSEAPFGQLKGRLTWPVQGRLINSYGQPRAGESLTWNGVMLESFQGAPVRAIYHGRVAFADWLSGLGLLLIVDHGDGYMSLYGHNEALLKESGDWVAPGEVIAQVGNTGGRPGPALYFEIRLNGKPIDPRPWIRNDR